MAAIPGPDTIFRPNVEFRGLRASQPFVFFGNRLGPECQRCGAYDQTNTGHRFCTRVACPIALIEFKRRNRRRTSRLEKVYLPRFAASLRLGR